MLTCEIKVNNAFLGIIYIHNETLKKDGER